MVDSVAMVATAAQVTNLERFTSRSQGGDERSTGR
jgi:hypothetical protein